MARRNHNHNNNRSFVVEFAEPWFNEYRTPFGTFTFSEGILDQINHYAVNVNSVTDQDLINMINQMRWNRDETAYI